MGKHVITNEHKVKVRLFVARQTTKKKEALVAEIPLTTDQLNPNDCFVLNTKETIYCLDGPGSSHIEKYEANKYAEHFEALRKDGVETTHDIDDKFWEFLKGPVPSWADSSKHQWKWQDLQRNRTEKNILLKNCKTDVLRGCFLTTRRKL